MSWQAESAPADVIVGAGINGLTAAALLARAGRKVLVLEASDRVGGALRTEEVTEPGFRHDLYAMNLGAFANGPACADLADDLRAQGLEFLRGERPFCSVFPDGEHVGISTDREATLASIRRACPEDVANWEELTRYFETVAPVLGPMMSAEFPSWPLLRSGLSAVRTLGWRQTLDTLRTVVQSTREFTAERLSSAKLRTLFSMWGCHADYPPDVAGGVLICLFETFGASTGDMLLARGGANAVPEALVGVIRQYGGEVRTTAEVRRIVASRRRVLGVVCADGTALPARTVIANTNVRVLHRLLPESALDSTNRARARSYRMAPGTMMIHLALDGLPDWRAADAREFAYVHIAPYQHDLARMYVQAIDGLLPEAPALVVGQPTVVDPERAPAGGHVLWIQVRMVPGTVTGDAAGVITGTDWDEIKDGYADRALAILEEYAPGLRGRIRGRAVHSPADLERANPNLIGGDQVSGSHHLDQFFCFRPAPGWTRHRTPVPGLYHVGAGTWPGAGSAGTAGRILARRLID